MVAKEEHEGGSWKDIPASAYACVYKSIKQW